MLAPLPEGLGLAARYPGDVGLAQDAAVVFADDFEALDFVALDMGGTRSPAQKWDNVWGLPRVTRDPECVHSGRQAVQVTHTSPRSHGADKLLRPGHDTLFVRYYMKYAADFPGCHHTGVALLGGAPGVNLGNSTGVRPDGRNHFTALVDTMPPWTGASPEPPGYIDIYCYHMDQSRKWGDLFYPTGEASEDRTRELFGEDFVPRPKVMAQLDRWHCYELMVQTNTPGARDGRIAFWLDGRLAGDFPNLRLRSVPSLKVNQIAMVSYSSSVHPGTTHWYDDLVAATSYLGPQVEK